MAFKDTDLQRIERLRKRLNLGSDMPTPSVVRLVLERYESGLKKDPEQRVA